LNLFPQLLQNSFEAGFCAPHLPQKTADCPICCGSARGPRPLIASTPNTTTNASRATIMIRLFCCRVSDQFNPPVVVAVVNVCVCACAGFCWIRSVAEVVFTFPAAVATTVSEYDPALAEDADRSRLRVDV